MIETFNNSDPLLRIIHESIDQAIKSNASDIHFEPGKTDYRIRIRLDGLLHTIKKPASDIAKRLTARLKVMSNLDMTEQRLPQDGHCYLNLQEKRINIRVSTCPTTYGEKAVLRILNGQQAQFTVNELGFNEEQKNLFLKHIHKPNGLILVCGPTGSGKTITLYAALDTLNTDSKNIVSIEDPVEIQMPGINQTNINPKIGLDFKRVLRSSLRQDPDIIMVGEIRDLETTEISIKAAQTGHLVLSTLHSNSALNAITRLKNMGVANYDLADSLSLIISQRLIRRLCDHCKSPVILAQHEQAIWQTKKTFTAQGCEHCHQGYDGRFAIYELIAVNNELSRQIAEGVPTHDMQKDLEFQSLKQAGIEALKKGLTSVEELKRTLA